MSIYGPIKKKNKKNKEAKEFLDKDHSDKNMLVTIRVRPLSEQEVANKIMSIVAVEDKLLIVRDKAELIYEK